MARQQITEDKLTQSKFDKETASMDLDLVALFNTYKDEVTKAIVDGHENGDTEDKILKDIEKILGD